MFADSCSLIGRRALRRHFKEARSSKGFERAKQRGIQPRAEPLQTLFGEEVSVRSMAALLGVSLQLYLPAGVCSTASAAGQLELFWWGGFF